MRGLLGEAPVNTWRVLCSAWSMPTAKRFEELICWQLSVELRDDIIRLTESGAAAREFRFRDQIRDSARSAASNLAEGFSLYQPRQFAKHARIARGSLAETRNHLLDARTQGYFSDADTARLLRLCARAQTATSRLIQYLDSCKGRGPKGWE